MGSRLGGSRPRPGMTIVSPFDAAASPNRARPRFCVIAEPLQPVCRGSTVNRHDKRMGDKDRPGFAFDLDGVLGSQQHPPLALVLRSEQLDAIADAGTGL